MTKTIRDDGVHRANRSANPRTIRAPGSPTAEQPARTIRVGRTLEDRAEDLERELESVRRQQRQCAHEWGPTRYEPRKTGGYSEPMRMVNTYGHEPPTVYVPPREVPRWTRTCSVCGHKQETERTRTTSAVKRGLTTTSQTPDFGDGR